MSAVHRATACALLLGSLVAAQTSLSGSHCVSPFCINAVYDGSSTLTYTVSTTSALSGWAAIGNGSDMAGSYMQVTWNNNGQVMLSERTATGEVTPTILSNPTSALVSSSSLANSSGFQSTFTVSTTLDSSSGSASVPMIWAYSASAPSTPSDSSSSIRQHSQQGKFTMSLATTSTTTTTSGSSAASTTSAAGAASTSDSGSSSTSSSDDDSSNDMDYALRLLQIHGWLAAVTFGVLMPFGVLSGRYGRTLFPSSWMQYHRLINGVLVPILAIVSIVLAFVGVHKMGGGDLDDLHMKLGLALFILIFVIILAGLINHHFYDPLRKRRPIRNWMHIFAGIVLLALGYYNLWTGLDDWAGVNGAEGRTKWQIILYWTWLGVLGLLFVAGWALVPKQLKAEKRAVRERRISAGVDSQEKLAVAEHI